MDPRRLLTFACAGLALAGCAAFRPAGTCQAPEPASADRTAAAPVTPAAPSASKPAFSAMAPIPDPPSRGTAARLRPRGQSVPAAATIAPTASPGSQGRTAIAAANLQAREWSRAEGFIGGVQVFAYEPGRVYEVWTAPLRVTTLTLAPGEAIVSKAAGDTVRWQIGETTSGAGKTQRAHVMIKPLRRGLETNLVLTTSERVYLIQLKSGAPETFNAAVAWDAAAATQASGDGAQAAAAPSPLVTPAGPLDARFRIVPHGRRPPWTPVTVMTDGVRTFLSFPPDLAAREAPALFVIGPGGETELVNYRQQDGLWVVDRVFDEAELRVGGRRAQVVRIIRTGGPS